MSIETYTDERKKAHAGVWRRAHGDDTITNFPQLAASLDQPVDYVLWALGDDKGRMSKMLRQRRQTSQRRRPWQEHAASSRYLKSLYNKDGEFVGAPPPDPADTAHREVFKIADDETLNQLLEELDQ